MTLDIQQRAAEAVRGLIDFAFAIDCDDELPHLPRVTARMREAAALITELAGHVSWRPISDKAKNGAEWLVWGPRMDRRVASYDADDPQWPWSDAEGRHRADAFTQYAPLPPPPEEKK